MNRRDFFRRGLSAVLGASFMTLSERLNAFQWFAQGVTGAALLPTRVLGKTGYKTTLFGLGGEGVLRTYGRYKEATRVIERALDLGVNYFDTAPAYSNSQDYYGVVFKNDSQKRKNIFLASKTQDRSYDGSMRLLEDSLKRLGTDYLDLWQLHDLRTAGDLRKIFSEDGAIRVITTYDYMRDRQT